MVRIVRHNYIEYALTAFTRDLGPALTFSQMLFISAQQFPNFVDWTTMRLKPREVPLLQWFLQVLVFASGSLLNNMVYAFAVPLTVQIIFRSAGTRAVFARILDISTKTL